MCKCIKWYKTWPIPWILSRTRKTGKVWYNNHYHCGDTAWIDEDGYYHFVGRNDDIIKSSGYRIGPYEVESAVLSHDAVSNCAITGYPDEVRGQICKSNNYSIKRI